MVISNEKTETNCFIIFINFKTADLLVEVLLPMLKEACIEDFLVFVNSYTNIDSNIDWDKAFFWRGSCPPLFFLLRPSSCYLSWNLKILELKIILQIYFFNPS